MGSIKTRLMEPEEYEYLREAYADSFTFDPPMLWKPIPGYEDYEISNCGDVCSYKSGEPVEIYGWKDAHGYSVVLLIDKNGNSHKELVHRLVAKAFIDNPEDHNIVRHYDDNPGNNLWTNLRWGTYQDNYDDMVRNGHDFTKPVYCYEHDKIYRSGAELADILGCTKSSITLACQGKIHSVYGVHVCFEDNMNERLAHLEEWLSERNGFKPLYGKCLETGKIMRFASRKEASESLGINNSLISLTVKGKLKQTHGWIFWEANYE